MSDGVRKPGAADEPGDAVLAGLYREAEREAPPAHLDAAILAAARREAGSGSRAIRDRMSGDAGTLRARRRAWGVSLALAAVIVLSVSILVLSPEMRDSVSPDSRSPAPFSSEGGRSQRQDVPERRALPPAAREAPQTPGVMQERFKVEAPEAAPRRAEAQATVSEWIREYGAQPPEKWGERILELRRQGRIADADALLDALRQRFPDYTIPPEWSR